MAVTYGVQFIGTNPRIDGITFDDVTLLHNYSDFGRHEIDLRSQLTKDEGNGIYVKRPFVSSPMDTVTEHEMAISMALYGGVGVIHNNFGLPTDSLQTRIELQTEEVRKVKRYENGFIEDPITVSPKDSITRVHELMAQYGIHTIPVTSDGSSHGILVGTISKNDYSLLNGKHGDSVVEDRMTGINDMVMAYWHDLGENSRLSAANDILLESHHGSLPILETDRSLKYLVSRTDIEKNEDYPNSTKDRNKRLVVFAAIGTQPDDHDRMEALFEAGADGVVFDSAENYKKFQRDFLRDGKKKYPDKFFVAGNLSTHDAAIAMIEWGADALRVGMGSGGICQTAKQIGVSAPQIFADYNCAYASRDMQDKYGYVPVWSDGGIRTPGDALKAIAAGAHAVMVGSLIAGTDETPGDVLNYRGKMIKVYRGMGSTDAVLKGGSGRYSVDGDDFISEGVVSHVPYKGSLSDHMSMIEEGMRRGMERVGAKNIEDLHSDKIRVLRISNAAQREANPHIGDIIGD